MTDMNAKARKPGPKKVLRAFVLEIADRLAEVDPEGFGMLVARSLAKMAELDPTGYDWLIVLLIRNTLEQSGFFEALGNLKQKLAAGDANGARQVAEAISQWTVEIDSLASQAAQVAAEQQHPATDKASKAYVM